MTTLSMSELYALIVALSTFASALHTLGDVSPAFGSERIIHPRFSEVSAQRHRLRISENRRSHTESTPSSKTGASHRHGALRGKYQMPIKYRKSIMGARRMAIDAVASGRAEGRHTAADELTWGAEEATGKAESSSQDCCKESHIVRRRDDENHVGHHTGVHEVHRTQTSARAASLKKSLLPDPGLRKQTQLRGYRKGNKAVSNDRGDEDAENGPSLLYSVTSSSTSSSSQHEIELQDVIKDKQTSRWNLHTTRSSKRIASSRARPVQSSHVHNLRSKKAKFPDLPHQPWHATHDASVADGSNTSQSGNASKRSRKGILNVCVKSEDRVNKNCPMSADELVKAMARDGSASNAFVQVQFANETSKESSPSHVDGEYEVTDESKQSIPVDSHKVISATVPNFNNTISDSSLEEAAASDSAHRHSDARHAGNRKGIISSNLAHDLMEVFDEIKIQLENLDSQMQTGTSDMAEDDSGGGVSMSMQRKELQDVASALPKLDRGRRMRTVGFPHANRTGWFPQAEPHRAQEANEEAETREHVRDDVFAKSANSSSSRRDNQTSIEDRHLLANSSSSRQHNQTLDEDRHLPPNSASSRQHNQTSNEDRLLLANSTSSKQHNQTINDTHLLKNDVEQKPKSSKESESTIPFKISGSLESFDDVATENDSDDLSSGFDSGEQSGDEISLTDLSKRVEQIEKALAVMLNVSASNSSEIIDAMSRNFDSSISYFATKEVLTNTIHRGNASELKSPKNPSSKEKVYTLLLPSNESGMHERDKDNEGDSLFLMNVGDALPYEGSETEGTNHANDTAEIGSQNRITDGHNTSSEEKLAFQQRSNETEVNNGERNLSFTTHRAGDGKSEERGPTSLVAVKNGTAPGDEKKKLDNSQGDLEKINPTLKSGRKHSKDRNVTQLLENILAIAKANSKEVLTGPFGSAMKFFVNNTKVSKIRSASRSHNRTSQNDTYDMLDITESLLSSIRKLFKAVESSLYSERKNSSSVMYRKSQGRNRTVHLGKSLAINKTGSAKALHDIMGNVTVLFANISTASGIQHKSRSPQSAYEEQLKLNQSDGALIPTQTNMATANSSGRMQEGLEKERLPQIKVDEQAPVMRTMQGESKNDFQITSKERSHFQIIEVDS